jgi:hypothetical protein
VLLVLRPLVAGADHDDVDRAARIAGARRPPFLAVEHIVAAVTPARHGDVGGVGGGDIGLGHQIGRADFPIEQRLQPALLLGCRAVALQHLHVARIGRRAVEAFRAEMGLAHLFSEIGVFHSGEPVAAL